MIKLSILIGDHRPFAFCLGDIVANGCEILETKYDHFYVELNKGAMNLLQLLEVPSAG